MRRKAERGKRDPPRGQLLFVAVGIRRNAGNSEVVRKIKDGGFDQFIQRFRVDLEALAIQKFNNVCFLLFAPAASGVNLFGGFDGNR